MGVWGGRGEVLSQVRKNGLKVSIQAYSSQLPHSEQKAREDKLRVLCYENCPISVFQ